VGQKWMEENKMRLIDADAIDFSEIKDDFDRARAKIIIMGQPTIKPQDGVVNFSHRLIIAKKFEEWCDECGATKVPLSMVAFLRLHNLLIVDECNQYAQRNKDILQK
jgi:hypothetical protein